MTKYVIGIDAGHHPNSANGGSKGYREGVAMMKLAKMLCAELSAYPAITPCMTRTDGDDKNPDNVVSLETRAARAARAGCCALFSLHTNAGGGKGTEIFYSLRNGDKLFTQGLCAAISSALAIPNRGAKTREYPGKPGVDYYAIIRESVKRGVRHAFLIEHAFHDNAVEERLLLDERNLKRIAAVEAERIAAWLGAAKTGTGVDTGGYTAIMGAPVATVSQMRNYLLQKNPGSMAMEFLHFPEIYLREGRREGVRGDIAFAQSLLETGNFKFGGDVKPEQNNFCELGAVGGGEPGNSFPTPEIGIRAQIQHLKAYASDDGLSGICVDPRFRWVKRGVSPYVEWLGIPDNPNRAGWAAGQNYGAKILSILASIRKQPTGTEKQEENHRQSS